MIIKVALGYSGALGGLVRNFRNAVKTRARVALQTTFLSVFPFVLASGMPGCEPACEELAQQHALFAGIRRDIIEGRAPEAPPEIMQAKLDEIDRTLSRIEQAQRDAECGGPY